MAGIVSEGNESGKSLDGTSSEALTEWRSSEQVENESPSTSPPYWDSDNDDEGAKPVELYGKHTWKIEKFSQINKRELRSSVFEVNGYKWYILIYPQGCDTPHHLSLFLCVANHDKFLPGWSHFAQFTIAVVNKDPKKSKYSDTLHRFWKKEHDWGWKKFMELSKVLDGFIEADTLIIKAQVQVIREKADRPFRCLDCHYRRELVRVYLSNVEQICCRFVEEQRSKLGKLLEDKTRWSSFCMFWLGNGQNTRRQMSREKKDVVLKVAVKQFFIEKEVTSTLVMDSLYSGLRALESQSMIKKAKMKLLEFDEIPAPIVHVDDDTFVLVDDVLLLLERASVEPLPPKDEKGPQNRKKDIGSGEEFNKDSIERDEKRLTDLGRRTLEIFVLSHIFSNKIEVAYQEAVAFKRQEELIREEEEAGLAEIERKGKCGGTEKEKKSKKKQAKQKRNSRKGKDKVKDDKPCATVLVRQAQECAGDEIKEIAKPVQRIETSDFLEDIFVVSDSIEHFEIDSKERDSSPVIWETETADINPTTETSNNGISGQLIVQNGIAEKKSSGMDDSSSTCSTDSVPSVVMNGPYKGYSLSIHKMQKLLIREKKQQCKQMKDETSLAHETSLSGVDLVDLNDVSGSCKVSESKPEASDRIKCIGESTVKVEKIGSPQGKLGTREQDEIDRRPSTKDKFRALPFPINLPCNNAQLKKLSSTDRPSQNLPPSKPEPPKISTLRQTNSSPNVLQVPAVSKIASSASLIPSAKPPTPIPSVAQTSAQLDYSAGEIDRYSPVQSYKNAIMGNLPPSNSTGFSLNPSPTYTQSTPSFVRHAPESIDFNSFKSPISFGTVGCANREIINSSRNGINVHELFPIDSPAGTSGRQMQAAALVDDFPYLDIINDLLDDEQNLGSVTNRPYFMNMQHSFHDDLGISGNVGSPSRCCKFERSQSYQSDVFHKGGLGSSGTYFNSFREYYPQGNQITQACPAISVIILYFGHQKGTEKGYCEGICLEQMGGLRFDDLFQEMFVVCRDFEGSCNPLIVTFFYFGGLVIRLRLLRQTCFLQSGDLPFSSCIVLNREKSPLIYNFMLIIVFTMAFKLKPLPKI